MTEYVLPLAASNAPYPEESVSNAAAVVVAAWSRMAVVPGAMPAANLSPAFLYCLAARYTAAVKSGLARTAGSRIVVPCGIVASAAVAV